MLEYIKTFVCIGIAIVGLCGITVKVWSDVILTSNVNNIDLIIGCCLVCGIIILISPNH